MLRTDMCEIGSILFSFIAILITLVLVLRTHLKKAAVGRKEMQLFLLGYALISLCEIFTVGGFPLEGGARRVCYEKNHSKFYWRNLMRL
jgi:membrane-bound metal-dependent hydrolase YbcI (DUF457 family)